MKRFTGKAGSTDFVRCVVPGTRGRRAGGDAPTLGIVGRLGGIGARPAKIGLVSDGDGAVTAVACALKLGRMMAKGDRLPGDVLISTHVCHDAPTMPHPVVTMMNSPVDMATLNAEEVRSEMKTILTVDTTRGNRIVNHRGIAVSPRVMQGWILRVAEDLLTVQQEVTGRMPVVSPITMQDITPYGNELFRVNSVLRAGRALLPRGRQGIRAGEVPLLRPRGVDEDPGALWLDEGAADDGEGLSIATPSMPR